MSANSSIGSTFLTESKFHLTLEEKVPDNFSTVVSSLCVFPLVFMECSEPNIKGFQCLPGSTMRPLNNNNKKIVIAQTQALKLWSASQIAPIC